MYRLLIVEDEYQISESLAGYDWGALGVELVGVCEHGLAAYQFIAQNAVDIVMTDIRMPIMDGMELIKLIKQNYPYICVVILSGHADFEYAREGIKYGIVDYLLKPVDFDEITVVFNKVKNEIATRKREQQRVEAAEKKNRLYASILRENFMKELLFNPISTEEAEEGFNYSEIPLEQESSYTVMIFRLDGFHESEIEYSAKDKRLIKFALGNVMNEICHSSVTTYYWVDKNKLDSYLLSICNDEREDKLRIVAEKVKEALYEICGLIKTTISCGIGSIQETPQRVYLSTKDAVRALQSAKERDAVMLYRPEMGSEDSTETTEIENGNEPVAEKDLNAESSKYIIDAAADYIHNNYMKSLTLEEIAETVHLNPAYFSQLFKKVCGMNYINYLTNYRIKMAKKLLKDPKFKIQQVSEAVGYENSRYFSHIFKKYSGCTPYEYRSRID